MTSSAMISSSNQCNYTIPNLHDSSILLFSYEVPLKIIDLICSFEDSYTGVNILLAASYIATNNPLSDKKLSSSLLLNIHKISKNFKEYPYALTLERQITAYNDLLDEYCSEEIKQFEKRLQLHFKRFFFNYPEELPELEVLKRQAIFFFKVGKHEEAKEALQKMKAIIDNQHFELIIWAKVYLAIIKIYVKMNDAENIQKCLETLKSIESFISDDDVIRSKFYMEIAKIHNKLGNNEDADKYLSFAYRNLEDKPEFKDILQSETPNECFDSRCDKIDEVFVAQYKELKSIDQTSCEKNARNKIIIDYLFLEDSLESEHLYL